MIKCPAHNDKTPSCKVWDGPDGTARFHCFAGCDWRDVRAGAEALGLVLPWNQNKSTPVSEARRRELERVRRERERAEVRDRERKRQWAKRIWQDTRPIANTPAAAYLESRSIKPPYPFSLRFVPLITHPVINHHGPAMVARVSSPDRRGTAIHLTFLDGSRKAGIDPAKVIIGPAAGGAIHLGEPKDSLIIAEGIETGLSAQQEFGRPAWAAMSTSMMKRLQLPPLPLARQIYIATDGDQVGIEAGHALARSARRSGRVVRVVAAPKGKDWNDVLQEQMK